jgi:hypothetical protein
MHGTLLMADQDVPEFVLVIVKGIVDRHDGPAWIAKNSVYALSKQQLKEEL